MPLPTGYSSTSIQNNKNDQVPEAVYQRRRVAAATGAVTARGFALYLGFDEAAAHSAGTTLGSLARDIRDFSHTLVDGLESHVAVAVGSPRAENSPIQSVFTAFGDPSILPPPRQDVAAPQRTRKSTPSGVLIDVSARTVHLDGDSVHLTSTEFQLMTYLIDNKTRIVNRQELLQHVRGRALKPPNENAIDLHIRRLRQKLGRLAKTIQTRRGSGYQFHGHPELTVFTAPEYMI